MPGLIQGQIYTYPRQRWRKKRRQYLTMHSRSFARAADAILDAEGDMHSISQVENPALQDTDSKDSQLLMKDDVKVCIKLWWVLVITLFIAVIILVYLFVGMVL